jgi:hypothetical protein
MQQQQQQQQRPIKMSIEICTQSVSFNREIKALSPPPLSVIIIYFFKSFFH